MNIAKRLVAGFSLILITFVIITECRNLCESVNDQKEEQINDETSSVTYETSTEVHLEATTVKIIPVRTKSIIILNTILIRSHSISF